MIRCSLRKTVYFHGYGTTGGTKISCSYSMYNLARVCELELPNTTTFLDPRSGKGNLDTQILYTRKLPARLTRQAKVEESLSLEIPLHIWKTEWNISTELCKKTAWRATLKETDVRSRIGCLLYTSRCV